MMRIEVPPKDWMSWLSVKKKMMVGMTAIAAMNKPPGNVMRRRVSLMYATVADPGRTPGMKPPCLRIFSAVSSGLNTMEV